eukprot:TRINITY_DN10030_c0_g1_i1.p1 TRINITY_DN10030_c0_g1~~TRINITY_DN10030_c0_g1_i1.p1  ORF type:complete len:160 (+),score=2.69 TRINITY_DN10030_c0_g1_i1:59-538(+)
MTQRMGTVGNRHPDLAVMHLFATYHGRFVELMCDRSQSLVLRAMIPSLSEGLRGAILVEVLPQLEQLSTDSHAQPTLLALLEAPLPVEALRSLAAHAMECAPTLGGHPLGRGVLILVKAVVVAWTWDLSDCSRAEEGSYMTDSRLHRYLACRQVSTGSL